MNELQSSPVAVYIISRVFDLEGSVNVKFFVDPAELEDNGELDFTEEMWSVTPASASYSNSVE